MRKPQLYLETSVWNFYFADDAPEKKITTLTFFNRIKSGDYDIFISDIVIEEITKAEESKKNQLLTLIKKNKPKRLLIDKDTTDLAQKYLSAKILPVNKFNDAMHAAVATIFEVDALISWNLKHLANFKKMEMINGLNLREGYYKRLQLITPMEVSYDE